MKTTYCYCDTMMVKLTLIFGVIFLSYLQTATTFRLKRHIKALRHRAELQKEYPGIGEDFIYVVDEQGVLKRLDLKGDKKANEIYQKFLKEEEEEEEETEHQNTGVQSFGLFGGSDNIPKKFNFNRNDISFTLFNRKNKDGTNLTNTFDFSKYDVKKQTKLVTHGFQSSGSSDTCVRIKNNYLEVKDINVIILDWAPIAKNVIYPITAANSAQVAQYTAGFLAYLIRHVGVSDKDVHLIGHSLGGHVVGFTGNRLILAYGIKIARITGLDPAGPLFRLIHLSKTAAHFVDIIHTNGGGLGLNKTLGHVDFYPNNGDSPQPGCDNYSILTIDSCSHSKSWEYFAETIKEKHKYIASCTGGIKHPMGAKTPPYARGICSLDTDTGSSTNGNGLFSLIEGGLKKIYNWFRSIFG